MKKLIRLTEGDLHRIIGNSVRRIVNEIGSNRKKRMNEAGNDDIENGVRGYEEYNGMTDDEYDDYANSIGNQYDDDDMQDYLSDLEADQYIDDDDHMLTDNELYNNF